MTSITPPLPFPVGPVGSEQSLANRDPAVASEPNFAAILAQARNGTPVEFDPVGMRIPLHELKSAIAHVFNAFGFFPAAPGQAEPTAVEDESLTAPASEVSEPVPAQTPSELTDVDPAQQVAATTLKVSAGGAAPVHVDKHAELHSAGQANPPVGKEPRAYAGPISYRGVAELHRAEPSRDRHGLEVSTTASRTGSEERDEVRFKIGDCAVDLLARLHNLTDVEETRLIAELQAVLEEHGFSLASATINGMPFATGLLGRNG